MACETFTASDCPLDCTSLLAAFDADQDCPISVYEGQIAWLLFTEDDAANDLTDWEDASEWATRLDNTTALGTAVSPIRYILIEGDLAAPADTEIDVAGKLKKLIKRERTMNWDLDRLNQTNYDGMRQLQCNGAHKIWYVDCAGWLYGGCSGISANISTYHNLVRDNGAKQTFTGTVTWNGIVDTARTDGSVTGLVASPGVTS